jgi:acetylornithine deacetylase/succinyl-diaminopimelate desuccinylase-like protein
VRATFGKRAVARGKRRQHSSSLHPGRHLSDGRVLVLWGAEDVAQARIHGPDESVDVAEIERSIIAQTLFITRLGEIRDSL